MIANSGGVELYIEEHGARDPVLVLHPATSTSPTHRQVRDYHRGHAEIPAYRWLPSATATRALAFACNRS